MIRRIGKESDLKILAARPKTPCGPSRGDKALDTVHLRRRSRRATAKVPGSSSLQEGAESSLSEAKRMAPERWRLSVRVPKSSSPEDPPRP
jgi:hypothetical protein